MCAHTGEIYRSQQVILAAGAWSAAWAAQPGIPLPLRPLAGQLATFPALTPPLRHLIFGEAIYLAPRSHAILVGATREERGFESQVTAEGVSWLQTAAARLVPALANCQVQRAWAGLRPRTLDARPILDWLPGWEKVLLATGHNSVGLLLSGITGQGVAQMLTTGQIPELFRPFTLQRFAQGGKQP
ncbi:MAG TPA: FAD-dependent oxidoreductase [Ktedonobacteraceae bacterium]|nr:FAD-dependent oxidoreductase [Ktedonobacteraceae bacterium]